MGAGASHGALIKISKTLQLMSKIIGRCVPETVSTFGGEDQLLRAATKE